LSETDSFIEEVSEEVRRDRLFGFFKKYAWVFALLVVLIVGGAAWSEYQKSQTEMAAQAIGEALLSAQATASAAAFAPLADNTMPSGVLAKMELAAALFDEGQAGAAADVLDEIAINPDVPMLYRDLALLKSVMINGPAMQENARAELFDKITLPGAPFRLLGLEQRAIAHVQAGDIQAALRDLAEIILDPNATQSLRNRAQELTVALGGDLSVPQNIVETSDG